MRTATLLLAGCAAAILVVAATPDAHAQRIRHLKGVRKVVIDPGHGGDNKGALAFNGVYEKDIVLEIALRVRKQLAAKTDAEVLLTREEDKTVSLETRIEMANSVQADLFISLHCNSSFSARPSGVETYVLSEDALEEESSKLSRQVVEPKGLYASAVDSSAAAVVKEMMQYAAHRDARSFATILQHTVARRTDAANRGVKELPIVILRGAEMPGVVIEVGFISNPVEAENLTRATFQQRVAAAIVESIVAFDRKLGEKKVPGRVASKPTLISSD